MTINNSGPVTSVNSISAELQVLYRVNVGGPEIAAIDGGIPWSADTSGNNSPFLIDAGSNNTTSFPALDPGPTIPNTTPSNIFDTERWDQAGGSEMQWAFEVEDGLYNVRLYLGNGFEGTSETGERVFDVAIEGTVPSNLENIDLSNQLGHLVGGVIDNTITVTDGMLNLDFLHGVENPLVNGIEISKITEAPPMTPPVADPIANTPPIDNATPTTPTVDNGTPIIPGVSIIGGPYTVAENDAQVQISLLTDVPVPSAESVDVTFEIIPGTATALEDYEYLSPNVSFDPQTETYTGTVSIAGSSSVATFFIDILQDTVAEPDEMLAVKITDISPNAEIVTTTPVSVTITDDEISNGTPLRLEAENADSITQYRLENIGVASNGQVLTFLGGSANEEGSATFGFNETPGSYDIVVGAFDENDGNAHFGVALNDIETGTTTNISEFILDANLGSNLANAQTFITPTVAYGVQLTAGDSITVTGFEHGTEHVRLDYIEFLPQK